MEPRIETLGSKKLVGMRMKMTFSDNRTAELWRWFMPRRDEVRVRLHPGFISMQIFEDLDDRGFRPDTAFEKWAAVEVADQEEIPFGMEPYALSGGKYAVFLHKGPEVRPQRRGSTYSEPGCLNRSMHWTIESISRFWQRITVRMIRMPWNYRS